MYKLILEGGLKLRLQEHFVSTDVVLTQIGVFKCAFITLFVSNSPPVENTTWSWLLAWGGADIKNHLFIFSMLTAVGRSNFYVWISLFCKGSAEQPVLWELRTSVLHFRVNYYLQELVLGLLHSMPWPAKQSMSKHLFSYDRGKQTPWEPQFFCDLLLRQPK